MPILSLDLKCTVSGISKLSPLDPAHFRWYIKVRCTNCGEAPDHWQYIVLNEKTEVPGSRGEVNLIEKCKLCSRLNTIAIVDNSIRSYDAENSGWQSIVKFDCRGIEPFDFDPRVGWVAVGTDSGTVFDDIDLSEKIWADYDELAAEATEITDVKVRFVHTKAK